MSCAALFYQTRITDNQKKPLKIQKTDAIVSNGLFCADAERTEIKENVNGR